MAGKRPSAQHDLATQYASRGLRVFPVNKKKRPLCKNGFKDATDDQKMLDYWWSLRRNALVAAPNDNFTVIDVDFKNACAALKMLTEMTVQNLFAVGIINERTPKVITPSGGYHFYFKASETLERRQFILPNIDLLAKNGLTVLPGQGGYELSNYDIPPYEVLSNLECLDIDLFNEFVEKNIEVTNSAKLLKATYREKMLREAAEKTRRIAPDDPSFDQNMVNYTMDFKTGKVTFAENDGLYEKAESTVEYEVSFDSNGMIDLRGESLTGGMISGIYYNPEVQIRLGKLVGVPIPQPTSRISFHSIFPNHSDGNPSMGVRWSKSGKNLIIRDFSNHYGSEKSQVDYDLIRLYLTCLYDSPFPRPSGVEFCVWAMEMLDRAGLIDITPFMKSYAKPLDSLHPTARLIAERILVLDAIKNMNDDYDGIFLFSQRFAQAWCRMKQSNASKTVRKLVDSGYLESLGNYDLTGNNNPNSFMSTPQYRIIEHRTKYKSRLNNT